MQELEEFLRYTAPIVQPVDVVNVLIALGMAIFFSFVVAALYLWEHWKTGYEQNFVQSLVFISVIVAAVIMVVGTNIAGAFGLVGAVSIIRFRTKLASPKDTAYMFLAISVGLACGLHHYIVGVAASCVAACVVCIFKLTQFAKEKRTSAVRVLSVRVSDIVAGRKSVERILLTCTELWEVLSVHAIDDQQAIIDYRLTLLPEISSEEVLQQLLEKSNGTFSVLRFEQSKRS